MPGQIGSFPSRFLTRFSALSLARVKFRAAQARSESGGTSMLPKIFLGKFSAAVWVLVILAVSILGAGQAHAQVAGATLSGTVKDASGAAIPNVQVSICSEKTFALWRKK
jgi:hypothetical protein